MPPLKLNQLEDALFTATTTVTGLPNDNIRLAYQGDSAPFVAMGEDVALLYITALDNAYDKQRELSYSKPIGGGTQLNEAASYTRVIECLWMVHGPNSFDNADAIRSGILSEAVREPLAALQIYPVPSIPPAVRVPEIHENQWLDRSDLRVRFYVATTRESTVNELSGVEILLYDEKGLQADINVAAPQ
jgi:hypothetical protein